MFSAESGDRTSALRNPRRRQRESSSDSLAVAQQQNKRRRHVGPQNETNDTLNISQSSRHSNGSISKHPLGHLNGSGRRDSFAADSSFDTASNLALRSKNGRREKRGGRSDDGIELTKTDTYVLTRDRGIPQALQEIINSEPWHTRLCPDLGYAVAFTQRQAIVWRYGHARSYTSQAAGTYVINLADTEATNTSKHDAFGSLPVGTLVHDAGAGDLALLVITPGNKIQYFESIRAASETSAVRSKVHTAGPLKGAISGLHSGEAITHVTEAEPDGFLFATDSGRLAHLSVRDPQGRPLVSTQYLKAPSADSQGLFGSIRNALKFGGPSQDIISINTIPGRERSHRTVLVANAKGVVRAWNIARHGPKTIENEWDLKENVADACRTVSAQSLQQEHATFLDLTLLPTNKDVPTSDLRAMALVSFPGTKSNHLFLIGIILREGAMDVDLVHPIRSYQGPDMTPDLIGRKFKPRLLVPQAGHSAFVISDTRIIVISLTKLEDTPSAQLAIENHDVADNYEECLFFNRKHSYHTVGCAAYPTDDRAEKSACDVFVYGFGHIRISASAAKADEMRNERRQRAIRSRLEQVVFFGSMPDNFLDFGHDAIWDDVTDDEINTAASEILHTILDSSSPYIPALSLSMDLQLKNRIQAVQDLNKFLRRWTVPAPSRWSLLWSAEKLVAARAVFSVYNESLNIRQPGQRMLLEEVCDMLPKDQNSQASQSDDTDRVRHYLTCNVDNFGEIVSWAEQAVDELYEEGVKNIEEQAPLVSQAGDIILAALDGALKFREQNVEAFGLGKDTIIDLVYQGDYASMDQQPWTCTEPIIDRVNLMTRLATETARNLDKLDLAELGLDDELLTKLADDAPKLVDANFRAWEEHCRWLESQTGDQSQQNAVQARGQYEAVRNDCLCSLSDIGLQYPATALAEKYHDMHALAMVTNGIRDQGNALVRDPSPEERAIGEGYLEEVNAKENGYFDVYGDHWADAFFQRQITERASARMLTRFPHRQQYLTQYLRGLKQADARVCRLSWINEVRGEKRFEQGAEDLMRAQSEEKRLWAKEVELSLAKLAKLAAVEQKQADNEAGLRDVKKIDQRIQISAKQENLYQFMRPELSGAIDDMAELGLARSVFCSDVEGKETLKGILLQNLLQVIRRQVLDIEPLIDTLSLISRGGDKILDPSFADSRFHTALWLLHSSGLDRMDPYRAELTEKCIWRRAIILDSWEALANTEGKSDDIVMDEFRNTMVYKTLFRGFESELLVKYPPPDPRSLHSVGETVADLRRSSRFDESCTDSYLANLAQDHSVEGDAVRTALSQGRLERRWQSLVEIVKLDLRGERDEKGQLMAWQEAQRQAVEDAMENEQPLEEVMLIPDRDESREPAQQQEPDVDSAVQNGGFGGFDGVDDTVNGAEHGNENGNGKAAEPKQQTTPRKTKKKVATAGKKGAKGSKKKDEVEKENKRDEQGDVVMFA